MVKIVLKTLLLILSLAWFQALFPTVMSWIDGASSMSQGEATRYWLLWAVPQLALVLWWALSISGKTRRVERRDDERGLDAAMPA
jgi:hypothetical protein